MATDDKTTPTTTTSEPKKRKRSVNAILRDVAHAMASTAPQRQDPTGALWLELRDAIDDGVK